MTPPVSRLSAFFRDLSSASPIRSHYLLAVFPNLADAVRAKQELNHAGRVDDDVISCLVKRWSSSLKNTCSRSYPRRRVFVRTAFSGWASIVVRLPLLVVLKHVVVAFQHIRDVFAKAPSRLERCVLNRSTNRGGAHDFDNILLLLTHRKIPLLKGVLLAEAVVSRATDLLNFTSKIHHLQSVFVVSS
jgi:hypothetical protein